MWQARAHRCRVSPAAASVKLVASTAASQAVDTGGAIGSILRKAVGRCPEAVVKIGGRPCCCLLDTGSQTSTITEAWFRRNMPEEDRGRLEDIHMAFNMPAANGGPIPYVGYLEMELVAADTHLPGSGFIIVKDPPKGSPLEQRKKIVPGIIGSNILRRLRDSLGGIFGRTYSCWVPRVTNGMAL